MQATPSKSTASGAAPAEQAAALIRRAQTGMLACLLFPSQQRDHFDYWQGRAHGLRDLARGAGAKLADKDAGLPYEPPSVLRAAAECLGDDFDLLPRRQIEQRLAEAGIELAAHAVTDRDVAATRQLEDGAVLPVDLHGEHAAARVEGDDGSGLHGGSSVERSL